MNIKIEYDGYYPCLCMGHLIITIDEKVWDFGSHALSSGGGINPNYEGTFEGDWEVSDCPENFPEDMKEFITFKINQEIPHGCCGGCI